MKVLTCPECGSENIQRARVAYDAGTVHTHGSSVSVGAAFSRGGTALLSGISSSEQTQRTMTAKRISPPNKMRDDHSAESRVASAPFLRPMAVVVALLALTAFETSAVLSMGLFCAAGLIWLYYEKTTPAAKKKIAEIKHYNEVLFPAEYAKWEESWLCHKCGYFGLVPPPTP